MERAYGEAQEQAEQLQVQRESVTERLVSRWTSRNAIYGLKPLDAEKLGLRPEETKYIQDDRIGRGLARFLRVIHESARESSVRYSCRLLFDETNQLSTGPSGLASRWIEHQFSRTAQLTIQNLMTSNRDAASTAI